MVANTVYDFFETLDGRLCPKFRLCRKFCVNFWPVLTVESWVCYSDGSSFCILSWFIS